VRAFGANLPPAKTMKTFWELVKEAYQDDILRILTAASIVSMIIGIFNDGIAQVTTSTALEVNA
jgi:hypothetical protein